MLNPVLSNVQIQIGDNFFPENITKKYDDFLYARNYPLKTMRACLHETIQNFTMPGIDLKTFTVEGLNNQRNANRKDFPNPVTQRTYPGHEPYEHILSNMSITITFKNNILNWLYCFEWIYKYYKRTREAFEFDVTVTMLDSAEIPILRFRLSDCFESSTPELEFSYTESFLTSRTFDMTFTFNKFDVTMLLPEFKMEVMKF